MMIADVDAASILTALASGASYRYEFIWFLLVLTIPLFFIQEASGRIGAVTGKGLGQLARERFPRRLASAAAVTMAVGDVATYIAEYAGIALGLSLFGIPPVISLPFAFLAHIALVARGRYAWVERVLIGISAGVVVSLAAVALHRGLLPYPLLAGSISPSFYLLLAANAGAVVMPFMLFFQSSATASKATSLSISRQSTLLGAIVSEALMVIVVVIGADIGGAFTFTSGAGFADALTAGLGQYATYALGAGLVAAAFLALVVISLGSAWGVTEALGLPKKSVFWIYVCGELSGRIRPPPISPADHTDPRAHGRDGLRSHRTGCLPRNDRLGPPRNGGGRVHRRLAVGLLVEPGVRRFDRSPRGRHLRVVNSAAQTRRPPRFGEG